jgi:hypothetical protein
MVRPRPCRDRDISQKGLHYAQRHAAPATANILLCRSVRRLSAWRAVWGALKSNLVYAARVAHLTGREHNKLSTGQAHAVLAAAVAAGNMAVTTSGCAKGRATRILNRSVHYR